MTRMRFRVPAAAALGALVAGVALVAGAGDASVHATLLVTAVVLGELLVLRLEDGTGVPLSYAGLLVITATFDPVSAAAAWAAAQLIAACIRFDARGLRGRVATLAQRLVVGVTGILVHRAVLSAFEDHRTLAVALVALGAAISVVIAIDEVARRIQRLGSGVTGRGVRAWSALATTGTLMALGDRGVDDGAVSGRGGTGMWSVALFAIPLLAAWYSFERLAAVTRTHRQTLRALSMATETAGFVREGHGERVAALCEQLATELGMASPQTDELVAAAYLHHLGVVTLDDPKRANDPARLALVAEVTGEMLAAIPALEGASRIVSSQHRMSRESGVAASRTAVGASVAETRQASQILKVASDFDELAEGDPLRAGLALEALYSTPAYLYDRRVLEALEVIIAA